MSRERSHGPVAVNIRLSPDDGHDATKRELDDVLERVIDTGSVPRGWKFAGIDWRNPQKASSGWRSGSIDDLDKFLPVLRELQLQGRLKGLRAAPIEGTQKALTRKQAAKLRSLERKLVGPRRHMLEAMRERDRRKTQEARGKWEGRRRREAQKVSKLQQQISGIRRRVAGRLEYELAADYKRGGRR